MNLEWLKTWIQSEAAATIIAVVIGAGLTILTSAIAERASRNNRKIELIREHQVDSIKEILHAMQNNDFQLGEILSLWDATMKKYGELVSEAQKQNIMINFERELEGKRNIILENREKIIYELWELRFLNYKEKQKGYIDEYCKEINEIIQILNKDNKVSDDNIKKEFGTHKDNVKTKQDMFIGDAKNGLS